MYHISWLTRELRAGSAALAGALDAGVAGFAFALLLDCSGLGAGAGGGVGAAVRERNGAARFTGTLGAFLRCDARGGERGLVTERSDDLVAWGGGGGGGRSHHLQNCTLQNNENRKHHQ